MTAATEVGTSAAEVPVLIAGGGLVGLTTAMFLAQHGIRSIAVERMRAGSPLPRAAHFHLRTIELFRAAGIEDEVRLQSEQDFVPEGALIAMDNLSGRKLADIIPGLNVGVDDSLTPCRRLFVNQPGLERVLRKRTEEVGAQVRAGCELVGFSQDPDGVTARVRDIDSGAESSLRCSYLVGADGAHSKVRDVLGIPLDGRGIFSNSITIYFRADLWRQLGGKPISIVYINNPMFGGFFRLQKDCQSGFMVVNTVGDPKIDPVKAANAAADTSEARLIELCAPAPACPTSTSRSMAWPAGVQPPTWRASSSVGASSSLATPHTSCRPTAVSAAIRVFMMRTISPGSSNGLKGVAGPGLLDSYEAERKPVAKFTVEQAYTRYVTRTATYLGATDYEPLAHDFNVELGYIYHSPAISPDNGDGKGHDDPRLTLGRPGARAPHLFLQRDGKRISTLDLFGRDFVLLAGPEGAAWCEAGRIEAGRLSGLQLDVHRVGSADLADPENRFCGAYGLSPTGACLVRPDGFVGWRAKASEPDPSASLATALRTLLCRS